MLRSFRDELIIYLIENNIPYSEVGIDGYDGIYIFEKDAFNKRKAYPLRYKELYVPYLRVSEFDQRDTQVYTKRYGLTKWMDKNEVMDIVDDLGGIA